jgi:hypothetical protein
MTAGRRYALGLVLVALLDAAVTALLPDAFRREAWLALVLALVVQAPLGWWLVESVGTSRMPAVWVVGMLARLGLVAVAGLVLVPARGLRAEGLLIPLALLLMVFVLLEGVVLMVQHSRVETR